MAQSLVQGDSRDFWKEIRKLTNRDKCTVLSIIYTLFYHFQTWDTV